MATNDTNARKNDGKKPKKEGRLRGTIKQLSAVYDFTRQQDPHLPLLMALSFGIPVIISIIVPLVWYRTSIPGWILTVLLGIMIGFTVAVYVLTNRSNTAMYAMAEGRPGATAMVIKNINNKAYTFNEEPIWADPRSKDMIWLGTSFSGIFLIGEGDYGRVQRAMDRQEKTIRKITQGSDIPIYRISVGNGPKQVPLRKLRSKIVRGHKIKLRRDELESLNNRLRSLRLRNNTMNMPKGMDPSRVHVSPRAMRGKN